MFPLKKAVCETTDFQQLTVTLAPASQFQATPTELVGDLEAMNTLRRVAALGGIGDLATYQQQLGVVASKGVARSSVSFTWGAAFGGDSARTTTSFSLATERAATLFNFGAALANSSSEAPPQQRCKAACGAAFVFSEARRVAANAVDMGHATAAEFENDQVLDALEAACLAMAQDAFVRKAVNDSLKHQLVAKLAKAAANLYSAAAQKATATSVFPAATLALFRANAAFFDATACFRQSRVVEQSSELGKYAQEIALLRSAKSSLERFDTSSSSTSLFQSILSKSTPTILDTDADTLPAALKLEIKSLLNETVALLGPAEKDNDAIYMEVIPTTLPAISPAVMVKPDSSSLSSYTPTPFTPLFSSIVPEHLREIQSQYFDSLSKRLAPFTQLTDATTASRAALSEMQLPAALETVSQTNSQFLHHLRSTSNLANMGTRPLDFQIAQHTTARDVCVSTLAGAIAALDQEEREDMEMRGPKGFGTRWTRLESRALTGGLRQAGAGYAQKLEAAKRSDDVVMAKVSQNYERICLAGEGNEEAVLVQLGGGEAQVDAERVEEVVKLKAVVTLLNDVFVKRVEIEKELEVMRKGDDIAARLLQLSETNDQLDASAIVEAELKKYDPLVEKCQASLKSQTSIMALITARNAKFTDWKRTHPILLKRDHFSTEFRSAHTSYKEIMTNLSGGIRFYTDFAPILTAFATNCTDFCMTRSIDKKEQLDELQRVSLENQQQQQQESMPVWDGNVNFSFSSAPPTSMPPPFKRKQ
ncbi:hypothetical protein HDU98_005910 [Podochytrium sp. JEL0797]|nr:hypothetical protein HDU98_005910 [Podochytrium sp. JEL0797]